MKKTILKHGIIAICLLFACYVAYAYYANHQGKYRYFELYTKNSLHGMVASSPVEMLGIEVGSVEQIELLKPRLARVVFTVNKKTPLTDKVKAKIITKGLSGKGFTGYVFIDLAEYPENIKTFSPPVKAHYPILELVADVNDSLDRQFNDITGDLNSITQTIEKLLDDKTIREAHNLISNLESVTEMLAENNRKMNLLINNMASVSFNLAPLSKTMNGTMTVLESQLVPELYNTLQVLKQLARQANLTIEKIEPDPSIVIRGEKTKPLGPGEKQRS